MAQVLLDLAKIITDAAQTIDAECKARGTTFPLLDEPFTPQSEAIRDEPAVASLTAVLAAAAEQIMLTAWSPPRSLFDGAFGFHTSSAIRTAGAVNVAEALREAGPKGLHVNDIVKGTVVDPEKLGRLMRLLASRHIFREVAPDVFANNRISSLMDTGKSLEDLRANPEKKYDGTSGLLALMECTLDEYFKASSYLTETMLDPVTAKSDSTTQAAMNVAMRTSDDYWTFIDKPENAYRLRRFGVAMQGARVMMPEIHIVQSGFPWKDFPQDSVIMDVGGGTGHVSMVLHQHFPQLKLVVQDRHQTIDHAKEWWGTENPKAIQTGRVELQGHDFFDPQPPRDPPALIMLRFILHDWADSYAIKILRNLRDAA
ncbi:S-adenosyl-L-methionine-dependent methyltransferase, partial [Exidia glandulosa HHB12029]